MSGGEATVRWLALVLVGVMGCRSRSEGPSPAASAGPSASASAPLAPLALDDLPSAVPEARCTRRDGAKVSAALEASLAALPTPIPERARRRFGFECANKPAVLVAIDYGDEALARRASLHYAHLFLLPADPTAALALPQGDLLRRGSVVAIVAGEGSAIGLALRDARGFGDAVVGYPRRGRGGASALPFVSKPGAFTAVRQARDYDYGCGDKLPATARACADLERYEHQKGDRGLQKKPETYVGACVPRPWPTPKSAAEEACWLLWSPFGVEMGTVSSLGVKLEGVSLARLREAGAAALPPAKVAELRYAILERGPGREVDYVDGAQRTISEDRKESLSVRLDETALVAVRATNDRAKRPLLVAGFARAGGLGP